MYKKLNKKKTEESNGRRTRSERHRKRSYINQMAELFTSTGTSESDSDNKAIHNETFTEDSCEETSFPSRSASSQVLPLEETQTNMAKSVDLVSDMIINLLKNQNEPKKTLKMRGF